jgi:hypothetical protein
MKYVLFKASIILNVYIFIDTFLFLVFLYFKLFISFLEERKYTKIAFKCHSCHKDERKRAFEMRKVVNI